MFETTVNDTTGILYYVDMVVEHEDYGAVTSSVFNPDDASDSKINGQLILKLKNSKIQFKFSNSSPVVRISES